MSRNGRRGARREGRKVLMEASAVDADDDPGIWDESVGLFERLDVFVSAGLEEDLKRGEAWYFEFAMSWLWRVRRCREVDVGQIWH